MRQIKVKKLYVKKDQQMLTDKIYFHNVFYIFNTFSFLNFPVVAPCEGVVYLFISSRIVVKFKSPNFPTMAISIAQLLRSSFIHYLLFSLFSI